MEIYLSLLSPVWWAGVLVCTILLSAGSAGHARRVTKRPGDRRLASPVTVRRARCAAWSAALLVLANLTMLGALAAANLRTPRLAGPVGLTFVLCCLVSLVLAVLVHSTTRHTEVHRSGKPGRGPDAERGAAYLISIVDW